MCEADRLKKTAAATAAPFAVMSVSDGIRTTKQGPAKALPGTLRTSYSQCIFACGRGAPSVHHVDGQTRKLTADLPRLSSPIQSGVSYSLFLFCVSFLTLSAFVAWWRTKNERTEYLLFYLFLQCCDYYYVRQKPDTFVCN